MGELRGKQWQPRDLAALFYDAGWTDAVHLTEAVQVCLGESQGYDHAYNDNVDSTGKALSRDVGLMEINIPADKIGTKVEQDLYDVHNNIAAARRLYEARGWQPWAAWTSRICFRDTYVKRAVRGVGNFLGERQLAQPADPDAKPRALTTPLLDYRYRLLGEHSALIQLRSGLSSLHGHVTGANITVVHKLQEIADAGLKWAKA